MGIQAVNQLAPDWYTPKSQEDESTPTRFRLKPLDTEEYMELSLEVEVNSAGNLAVTGKGMRMALAFGLIGWENFTGEEGAVPFKRANFGRIPLDVLSELAQAIISRSDVGGEQEKN